MFLGQHHHVRSNCESGCPADQSGRVHTGAWLLGSSTAVQKLWFLGASVMLILMHWECKKWFSIRRKIKKAAAVQTGRSVPNEVQVFKAFMGDVK